jgi:uncharacterized membrane protein YczE
LGAVGEPATLESRLDAAAEHNRCDTACVCARWVVFLVGITALAVGMSLVIRADLGAGPWTVFHLGLSRITGLSVGRITQAVGLLVIGAAAILLRRRPRIGTVVNMILIGFIVDASLYLIGPQSSLLLRTLYLVVGVILTGAGTAVYISADLGEGPRDCFMMGLHVVTRWSIRAIRTAMEILVLLTGAALGGRVGIGTIAAALLTGCIIQATMGVISNYTPWRRSAQAVE